MQASISIFVDSDGTLPSASPQATKLGQQPISASCRLHGCAFRRRVLNDVRRRPFAGGANHDVARHSESYRIVSTLPLPRLCAIALGPLTALLALPACLRVAVARPA